MQCLCRLIKQRSDGSLDPALRNSAIADVKTLLTLAIFAGMGSFPLGALVTGIRKGMKEEGWFKFNQEKEEQD